MGDGWRLVVADHTRTFVVPVKVYDALADSHPDLSWIASCDLDGRHVFGCGRDQFEGMEALGYLISNLHREGFVVREVVPPGEQTAEERLATARAEEREACAQACDEARRAEVARFPGSYPSSLLLVLDAHEDCALAIRTRGGDR